MKVRARLGPEGPDAKTVQTLDRVAERCPNRFRNNAYQRRAEEVAQTLGLAEGKAAVAPGARGTKRSAEDGERPGALDARWFRGLVAILNLVARGRPDIQYATKEVCRERSAPNKGCSRKKPPRWVIQFL